SGIRVCTTRPPGRSRASSTTTSAPPAFRSSAAESPARPAPTTTTSCLAIRLPSRSAEPALAPARSELPLLGDDGLGRRREGARRPGGREEVDIDAPAPAASELDVAGAASFVSGRRIRAPDLRQNLSGDDPRRPLGEHARLGHPHGRDVADRVDT